MKKFIIALICLLFVAGFGYSIYLNFDAFKAQATLYTKQQLDEAVENAYKEGNANEEQYRQQIATLQNSLEIAEQKLLQLNVLIEENSLLSNENEQLKTEINELETLILRLEGEIRYYQELLKISGNKELIFINFYYDTILLETKVIEKGSTIKEAVNIRIIEDYGGKCEGWELSDGSGIDLSWHQFFENTDVFAKVSGVYSLKSNIPTFNLYSTEGNEYGMRVKLNDTYSYPASRISEGTRVTVEFWFLATSYKPTSIKNRICYVDGFISDWSDNLQYMQPTVHDSFLDSVGVWVKYEMYFTMSDNVEFLCEFDYDPTNSSTWYLNI